MNSLLPGEPLMQTRERRVFVREKDNYYLEKLHIVTGNG